MALNEHIKKILSCQHDYDNIVYDCEHNIIDNISNTYVKTKMVKLLCSKCSQIITLEYLLENRSTD
jgi:hypothetical protein